MIKLQNISHQYEEKSILKNLNLTIEDNQITCLLGSSGSGKTTILRLISGLETVQNGILSIDKKIVSENNNLIIPPQQRNIGFVFQDLALWPHFSIYKNIAFGLEEKKELSKIEIKKTVLNILDFFKLQEHQNKYPHQLSGGQQQLVAIARSLVLKPKILLMDEPLANLDVKLKRKILAYIKNIKEQFDINIIYVTHDHREAFSMADTIIVLNQGKIEAQGSIDEIKNSTNEFVQYFLEY